MKVRGSSGVIIVNQRLYTGAAGIQLTVVLTANSHIGTGIFPLIDRFID